MIFHVLVVEGQQKGEVRGARAGHRSHREPHTGACPALIRTEAAELALGHSSGPEAAKLLQQVRLAACVKV